MQNPEGVKIVGRFFEALHELKRREAIKRICTFTKRYGINQGNLYQLEKDKSRDILQLSWLSSLVSDFGVSADWLLTGNGEMFKPQNEYYDPRLRCAFWIK